jgi:hypothetical protein
MDEMEKFAMEKFASAYFEEFDRLCDFAEADGNIDPAFTREKRAAFGYLLGAVDQEDLGFLDKLAWAELGPIHKVAIMSGLGKDAGALSAIGKVFQVGGRLLSGPGRGLSALGGKLTGIAGRPSGGFAQHFARKGMNPEQIQGAWGKYKELGMEGWLRARRAVMPAFAGPRAAGAATPAAAAAMPAHPISRMKGFSLSKMTGSKDPGLKYMAQSEIKRRTTANAASAAARAGKRRKALAAAKPTLTKVKGGKVEGEAAAEKGLWPSVKGGLTWGAGFGLAQRALAPDEPEEVMIGGGGY